MGNELKYTHEGRFCGIAPVRINMDAGVDTFEVEAKYGRLGELWLDIVEGGYGFCIFFMTVLDATYEPKFPFTVTKGERDYFED